MDHEQITHAIRHCEFFKGLEQTYVDKIADLCRVQSYEVGEHVFQQGRMGQNMYVISEGRVILERKIDLGTRKGNVTIAALGTGRVLGCWSTLLGEPHMLLSSAVCQKPSTILAITGSELRRMMLADKELGFKLMENFCFLLRDRIQSAYGALEKL